MGKKGKKGKHKKHYGRKIKQHVSKARQKTFRILKGIALEGPLIAYVAEGVLMGRGQPLSIRVMDFASRLSVGTTGIRYTGTGTVKWEPQMMLLGWGGPLAYKGIQFAVNMIPGKKDSPFAELSAITG